MKILAVIPARSGSKAIPNKNIRIVNDKPLIEYAINNAKNSQYVTDVVVTTDSPEVISIAKQLGVNVKIRSKDLCDDNVTLDPVIIDAIPKDRDWDYIITLQPTSPALSVYTLDKAIEYAINSNFDTVISVCNRPHLSWKEKDGEIVPCYEKRLNRQCLPKYYEETGSFFIFKYRADIRGQVSGKVGVYEVPENEAVDINTFDDLVKAEFFLKQRSIGIYVNGNNRLGLGHIYRMLELADSLYVRPDIFYNETITPRGFFGNTTHNLIPVKDDSELLEQCRKKEFGIFVNDILTTSEEYMKALRSLLPNAKIINFEDEAEGHGFADCVFNALLSRPQRACTFAGSGYYFAGKMYLCRKPITINERVSRVIISFGGADPMGYTKRVLNIIKSPKYEEIHFTVVLGRATENPDTIIKLFSSDNIDVVFDVSNMAELISRADVGITSCGRTTYEFAILGLPTIAMAQNAREEEHLFVREENGFLYLGSNPSEHAIEKAMDEYFVSTVEFRKTCQDKMLKTDLVNGRKRILQVVNNE